MSNFVLPSKTLIRSRYFRNLQGFNRDLLTKKLLNSLNFKHAKSINIEFNPFHKNTYSIRCFSYVVSVPKWTRTNVNLAIKNVVKTDSSEPRITIAFNSGSDLEFRTAHMTCTEIVKVLIAHYKAFYEAADAANIGDYE